MTDTTTPAAGANTPDPTPENAPAKAWSGRFTEPVSELVKRYTASVFFDQRMAAQDIRGSLAHAKMLARQGIIGAHDLADIERGMAQIAGEIARGELLFTLSLDARAELPTTAALSSESEAPAAWIVR